jgi:predicted DNA-binding protein with PD1-like motif
MKVFAHVPRLGRKSARWLFEALLIVASVLLAFGVDEYREARTNRALAVRVLNGLRTEIEHNMKSVEAQQRLHQRWVNALGGWLQQDSQAMATGSPTGWNVFVATWPEFNKNDIKAPFIAPRRGAWDAALSTGALRLIDYDVSARLSQIYDWQSSLAKAIDALPYSSTSFFDPASRRPAVEHVAFQLEAIALTEGFLLEAYREHLPAIRAAAEAGR